MAVAYGALADATDDELMVRLQEGDHGAFAILVDRHEALLIGFFRLNTHDWHLAEDLAQETLLKLFRECWDYLPLGRFRGWMFRIARNLMIDDIRRRSRDALLRAMRHSTDCAEIDIDTIVSDILEPHTIVNREELRRAIEAAVAELPEDQRQTFTLHYHVQLELREVAQITEVPVATCKSRLRLAREKLADALRRGGFAPQECQT